MLTKVLIGSLLSLAGLNAHAGWTVDPQQSEINFISVKNDAVGETHHFKTFSGDLTDAGKLSITIDLNSVDTGIEIRDQRLKEYLFDTEQFPAATLNAEIEPAFIGSLEGTNPVKYPLQATLSIAGNSVLLNTEVTVQPISTQTLRVTNSKPILLSAKALGVVEGVNKLREIAGLKSIDYVVPVTFDISLQQEKSE
ncbi:YceI family protein [Kangiella shandongensis]|uniref:YceI family protein n=1 Tax=Kangiella shandongensis TaxID=2763258 RepID=UPI001CBF9F3D|nr:YceI family protein [Kangiella shandongensis]